MENKTITPGSRLGGAATNFLAATEQLLDWMNGNELSADHKMQRPEDYNMLCRTLVDLRAALSATATEGE